MEIKIYTSDNCKYCDQAKTYFKENKIEYTEYNVKEDLTRRQEAIDISGKMGVPIIKIGEEVMAGWSEDSFKRIYTN